MMTIAHLDTPLRVTWDLHSAAGPMPRTAALTVADRLVDAGLFYVTLLNRPLAHPQIGEVLERLAGGGVQVQATFCGTQVEWQGVAAITPAPEILVDAGSFLLDGDEGEWNRLRDVIERLRTSGSRPTLLMVPDRQRLPLIPALCNFCRSIGVTRIKLPNTPVDASFPGESGALLPDLAQLSALREVVTDPAALRAGLTMEVHDLFLWEILFPGERGSGRSEYDGCQAANSLAHIDADGRVHPCSSWPQELGSLLDHSFVEIWQSVGRSAILSRIAALPADCADCGEYSVCFGGCRGLVATFGSTADRRDLLCAGRRPFPTQGCD